MFCLQYDSSHSRNPYRRVTFDRQLGTCGGGSGSEGHRAGVFNRQLFQQEQVAATVFKRHDFSTGRFFDRFSVEKPAAIFALRTRESALKEGFASIKGLHILQALDNGNGFGCNKNENLNQERF